MLTSAFALATALALGAPNLAPLVELSLATYERAPARRPDLALHLDVLGAGGVPGALEGGPRRRAIAGLPVCSGDVCQAAVSVPGFDPRYDSRSARSDAFAALLARARVEPFATVGRALAVTGVRVDYSPAAFESPGSGARGWGSVLLRVRLKVDANAALVIPPPPR